MLAKIKIDLSVALLITILVLLLALPVAIFKFGYLDNKKKHQWAVTNLSEIKNNTAGISKLMENPESFTEFIQEMGAQKEILMGLRPVAIEMLSAQKLLARFAKDSQVSIVSLKPTSSSQDLLLIEGGDEEGSSQPKASKDIQVNLIEVQFRGTYQNMCAYFQKIENTKEATLGINNFHIEKASEEHGDLIEVYLHVKLFYPVS